MSDLTKDLSLGMSLGIKFQMRRAYEGEGCYLWQRRLTLYGEG